MQNLIDGYIDWFKLNFYIEKQSNGWITLTTPFLDNYNDAIVVYIKKDKDNIITLSDDSWTLMTMPKNLEKTSEEDKKRYHQIIRGIKNYGVAVTKDNKMLSTTDSINFSVDLHNFICAIIYANNILSIG